MLLSEVEQPAVADQEQDDDAPDQVMDVVAAHGNPLEGAGLVDDGADQEANAREGEKKCDGGQKGAPTGPVGDGGADEESNTSELHQDQQDDDDEGGKGQQYKCSGTGHNLL